ncbi:MAG: DUF4277 domain-containing protein [Victivallales bacterium]|nr:DUF4277 domain-containing protein [Victivallales bacterium]
MSDLSPDLRVAIRTMEVCGIDRLPVVSSFCNAIRLQEVVDGFVKPRMDVSPGAVVQAMVLDTIFSRFCIGK